MERHGVERRDAEPERLRQLVQGSDGAAMDSSDEVEAVNEPASKAA
jgi:hypothetical protein